MGISVVAAEERAKRPDRGQNTSVAVSAARDMGEGPSDNELVRRVGEPTELRWLNCTSVLVGGATRWPAGSVLMSGGPRMWCRKCF